MASSPIFLGRQTLSCIPRCFGRPLLPLLFPVILALPAVASDDVKQHTANEVPVAVVPGATACLKARVGQRFFRECITPGDRPGWYMNPVQQDSSRESRMVGAWHVYFQLAVPSKPFARGLITVFVDSSGAPVESFDITGIGRCVSHPKECEFSIDEGGARQIARRGG